MLLDIVHEEDSTRPASFSQCCVGPNSTFSEVPDIINLNYRGEGIGDTAAYALNQTTASTKGPEFPEFHARFPKKLLLSSEYGAGLSTRGFYKFPVANITTGVPVSDTDGGNSTSRFISSYDLYTTDAGSPPDKVFAVQEKYPYVAGGFVWSGWDYIGEPHPYLLSRSSAFGIIDLAGFKKDRFFLYQSHWRPDLRMAHILPHWTWPERIGLVTPVHVYSAADEAELFLNGRSQGRLKKEPYTYRFRWDQVVYEPGELRVATYMNGTVWADDVVKKTAGAATKLRLEADRNNIENDGVDLSFITVAVTDSVGDLAPRAGDIITFSVIGPGEIVATDNGDSTDITVFPSPIRRAFNGQALVIARAKPGASGTFTVTASAPGLEKAQLNIEATKSPNNWLG
jgi:beta-galactosidase